VCPDIFAFRIFEQLALALKNRAYPSEYPTPGAFSLSIQRYDGCIGWVILILQPLQTFVELARCERVMTARAEFHFSWVYTFSATPRSLRIWAPVPLRETGCDPALPAQLCWKTACALTFCTVLNILFAFRIFEQLLLALKTECALKFFKPGGAADPPRPPASYAYDQEHRSLALRMWELLAFEYVKTGVGKEHNFRKIKSM